MTMISTIRNTLIVVNVNNSVANGERLVMDKALNVKMPTIISATTAPIKSTKNITEYYSTKQRRLIRTSIDKGKP